MAARLREIGLVLLLLALAVMLPRFEANAAEPQFDQRLFVTQIFAPDDFPALSDGISSFLVAGIYNHLAGHTFDANLITADVALKTGAAALFLIAGYLLFTSRARPRQPWLALVCLALILTTRFPFGWLTTEVLAGAFLMLALWSYGHCISTSPATPSKHPTGRHIVRPRNAARGPSVAGWPGGC